MQCGTKCDIDFDASLALGRARVQAFQVLASENTPILSGRPCSRLGEVEVEVERLEA
jgi:hypothetical protein